MTREQKITLGEMRPPMPVHEAQEWQAAMEALILVATSGDPRCLRASASCEP